MTGPCAFGLSQALHRLLSPVNEQLIHRMSRGPLDRDLAADLSTFVTGGWAAVISAWVIEGPEPLDPEAFADRLLRMAPVIAGAGGETATAEAKEHGVS